MRMNVGNWNVQHRTMKRVRRMSIVVTVWRLDTENREIVPITPGASLAVIRDMNAEYVLVATQVQGGTKWLTVRKLRQEERAEVWGLLGGGIAGDRRASCILLAG